MAPHSLQIPRWRIPARSSRAGAFTLIEMMVAMVILLIVMIVLFQLTASMGNIWSSSAGKVASFQSARSAFATLNQTLARATLGTYTDYANLSTTGAYTYRTSANQSTFIPTTFYRASSLHFLCGPAGGPNYAGLVAGAGANAGAIYPGHAVFFQANLGVTNSANYDYLPRALNSVGFYVEYGRPDTRLMPTWLYNYTSLSNPYRFRLVQCVEPQENLSVYASTALTTYDASWLSFGTPLTQAGVPVSGAVPRTRVLAEDILLLIFRPRLDPKDEATEINTLNLSNNQYPAGSFGGVLSPNYVYDSRAWETGYPYAYRSSGTYCVNGYPGENPPLTTAQLSQLTQLQCNQVPPVIDVAMVCADSKSIARYQQAAGLPPADLQLPAAGTTLANGKVVPAFGLFTNSANLESDLSTYAVYLGSKHVHFHIMRSSVQIQGSKWSNN